MTTQLPNVPTNGHDHSALAAGSPQTSADGVRIYRGRSVEELIPQIREELGEHAVILRQREGLVGGVGGFFAQRCVEVEARAGGPGVNVYDDDDDQDDAPAIPTFAGELEAAADEAPQTAPQRWNPAPAQPQHQPEARPEPVRYAETQYEPEPVFDDADPFIEEPEAPAPAPARARAQRRPARWGKRDERPEPRTPAHTVPRPSAPAPAPAPAVQRSGTSHVIERLCELGASEQWAAALQTQGAIHSSPFAVEGNLTGAVLDTLTRSLPQAQPLPLGGGAIAFVGAGGSGKTSCVAGLAAAYRRAGTLAVTVIAIGSRDQGRTLGELLAPVGVTVEAFATAREAAGRIDEARATGLVIVDTAAPRPGDSAEIEALADDLDALELDAIHLTLPATLGPKAAQRLLSAMEPIAYTSLALTHVDETDQLGLALELSCTCMLPIAYLHEGVDVASSLSAPHPAQLAARVL